MIANRKEVAGFIVVLGLWLCFTAFSFGPLTLNIFYSDLISGALLILLGSCSFHKAHTVYFFIFFGIGLWLNFAPLVFWVPEKVEYINDTAVGLALLVSSFRFLSGFQEKRKTSAIPKGWSFNPSAYPHRGLIILLAVLCWLLARYLDGYELGYYLAPWDPIFGDGTKEVLSSKISRSLPLPDAGVGALAYSLEAILCWQGGEDRWKRHPWLVLFFGVLAVPVSLTSILLITLQPLAVHAWCFICLLIAFLMLFIVCLAFPEVIATCQLLKQESKQGRSVLKALVGGSNENLPSVPSSGAERIFVGMNPHWTQIVLILLSLGLFFFTSTRDLPEAHLEQVSVIGILILIFSLLSFAEALRTLRFANVLLSLWLIALAIFSGVGSSMGVEIAFALSFALFSIPKGKMREEFGNWNRLVF